MLYCSICEIWYKNRIQVCPNCGTRVPKHFEDIEEFWDKKFEPSSSFNKPVEPGKNGFFDKFGGWSPLPQADNTMIIKNLMNALNNAGIPCITTSSVLRAPRYFGDEPYHATIFVPDKQFIKALHVFNQITGFDEPDSFDW